MFTRKVWGVLAQITARARDDLFFSAVDLFFALRSNLGGKSDFCGRDDLQSRDGMG